MQRRIILLVCVLIMAGCTFGGQSPTALPTLPAVATANATSAATSAVASVPTTGSAASSTSATKLPATSVPPTKIPATPVRPTNIPPTAVPATSVPAAGSTTVPPTVAVVSAAPTTSAGAANPPTAQPAGNGVASVPTTGATPRVLAWNKDAKLLGWYASTGQPQTVLSGAASRVMLCGAEPSGAHLIVYHGDSTAQPQVITTDGSGQPQPLGDSSALACDLGGRTAYSPDGQRLGYIKYAANATVGADYTSGTLRILTTADASQLITFDNVTAFDLENDGAVILKFFANSKAQSDHADLTWWDAATNKERPLEANFQSLANCVFASGRIVKVADKVYTALGERCTKPTGSVYRVLRTDFAGGNSTNFVDKTNTGGKYYPNTNTNDLIALPDGQTLLLAYPNGQTTEISNLVRIGLADGKVTPVFSGIISDQASQASRRFLLNPQKTQLAFVTRNPNNGETLYLYDLTHPDTDPVAVTTANRSNRLNGVAWNQAGDRIVYIETGDDSDLSYFDLNGSKKLVLRGTFQGLALSPDGTIAVTSEQAQISTNDVRNNLVQIALSDGTKTALVNGDKGASALVPLAVR